MAFKGLQLEKFISMDFFLIKIGIFLNSINFLSSSSKLHKSLGYPMVHCGTLRYTFRWTLALNSLVFKMSTNFESPCKWNRSQYKNVYRVLHFFIALRHPVYRNAFLRVFTIMESRCRLDHRNFRSLFMTKTRKVERPLKRIPECPLINFKSSVGLSQFYCVVNCHKKKWAEPKRDFWVWQVRKKADFLFHHSEWD